MLADTLLTLALAVPLLAGSVYLLMVRKDIADGMLHDYSVVHNWYIALPLTIAISAVAFLKVAAMGGNDFLAQAAHESPFGWLLILVMAVHFFAPITMASLVVQTWQYRRRNTGMNARHSKSAKG